MRRTVSRPTHRSAISLIIKLISIEKEAVNQIFKFRVVSPRALRPRHWPSATGAPRPHGCGSRTLDTRDRRRVLARSRRHQFDGENPARCTFSAHVLRNRAPWAAPETRRQRLPSARDWLQHRDQGIHSSRQKRPRPLCPRAQHKEGNCAEQAVSAAEPGSAYARKGHAGGEGRGRVSAAVRRQKAARSPKIAVVKDLRGFKAPTGYVSGKLLHAPRNRRVGDQGLSLPWNLLASIIHYRTLHSGNYWAFGRRTARY